MYPNSRCDAFPWVTFAVCALSTGLYAWAGAWPALGHAAPLDTGNALDIITLGGRSTPLVADAGESWRLLSCHFVHTSGMHLAFNLAFLFAVGGALEHVSRRADYAALLLFSAVTSAVVSLFGTPQVSAGSSGIVFGVLGAAVTFGLRYHDRLAPQVRRYFGLWVLPFLVVLFWVGMRNPAVDHASHLGGLCAGLLGGLALPIALPNYPWLPLRRHRPVRLALVASASVAVLWLAPAMIGSPRRAVQGPGGLVLHVPAHWAPRYDTRGGFEFTTAGGMVVLTADLVPASLQHDPQSWYEREYIAPLAAGTRATKLEESGPAARGAGWWALYRLERDGVTMTRDVYFLRDAGTRSVTVVTFETPDGWRPKYADTRRSVLRSMRRPPPPTKLSAAAAP